MKICTTSFSLQCALYLTDNFACGGLLCAELRGTYADQGRQSQGDFLREVGSELGSEGGVRVGQDPEDGEVKMLQQK